jgi:hypothetical protein
MSVHIGQCVYLIYADDTEQELLGFVYPGVEFVAKTLDGTEVGRADSIDQAGAYLLSGD